VREECGGGEREKEKVVRGEKRQQRGDQREER
jgi:hypothetical protein